jgi:starch-binding outer membrane protein, SusD/RagB family
MYKKLSYLIISIAVFGSACKKDPVNVYANNSYNSGTFPQDTAQLFSLLVTGYSQLRSAGMYGFEFRSHDFNCADHTADLNYNGDQSWTNVTQNNMRADNNYAKDVWSECYKGIQYTNTFLDRTDFFEKNYAKPEQLGSVNIMRGEDHFLRALYYYYLECFYGEAYISGGSGGDQLGVPIIQTAASTLDSTQTARATVRQTWDFIISELQQSISLLHGVIWDPLNEGRVTEWAAKSLLGKVYVYTQDWGNAKTVLLDVINNSGKTLMPYSKYINAFGGNSANEFNEESLFELNVDATEACYGIFCGDYNVTSSDALALGPTVLGDDGTQIHPRGTGYNNESFHDRNLARFGFNLPVQTLVPNPAFDPSLPGSPSNLDSILDPAYRTQSLNLRINKLVDPRLYLNALQPWIDSSGIGSPGEPYQGRPVVRYSNLNNSYYGWSFHKYAQVDVDINTQHAAASANVYVLRLADVFLLYAEACANSGDDANALEYINKVKRRAYDYDYNSPSPVDYASLTSATSASAAGDPVLGNNPLYYERYAELMGEANWWFDVCRWKIGDSEAAWYQKTFAGGPITWNDSKSYVWPIPTVEISNNKLIKQNPNY